MNYLKNNMKISIIKHIFLPVLLCIFAFGIPLCVRAKGLHIVLDPGHGGIQSGAERLDGSKTVSEKDLNLTLSLRLREELQKYEDVTVSMTRESDRKLGLEERFQFAVDEQADVFISLHNNANGGAFEYDHGCTVLTAKGQYQPELAWKEQELGCSILYELSSLGLEDQGLLLRTSESGDLYPNGELADYYGLIRAGVLHDLPGIIIEHAFLDHNDDYARYLSSEESIKKLAEADARGIARYFGLIHKDSGETLPPLKNFKEKLLWVKDEDPTHNETEWKVFYPSEDAKDLEEKIEGMIQAMLRVVTLTKSE